MFTNEKSDNQANGGMIEKKAKSEKGMREKKGKKKPP